MLCRESVAGRAKLRNRNAGRSLNDVDFPHDQTADPLDPWRLPPSSVPRALAALFHGGRIPLSSANSAGPLPQGTPTDLAFGLILSARALAHAGYAADAKAILVRAVRDLPRGETSRPLNLTSLYGVAAETLAEIEKKGVRSEGTSRSNP